MSNEVLWLKAFNVTEAATDPLIVNDKSGNGNYGTFNGDALYGMIAGYGRVLSFPGDDGYISVASDSEIAMSAQVTVGAHIYKTSDTACIIVEKNQSYRLQFADNTNKPQFSVYSGGAWRTITSAIAIPEDQWIFIEGTFDGSTLNLFVHGKVQTPVAHSGVITTNSNAVNIGGSGSGNNFEGYIAEILVRDTTTDIIQHREDLKRWLRKEQEIVIELLEVFIPGNAPLRVTSASESITIAVNKVAASYDPDSAYLTNVSNTVDLKYAIDGNVSNTVQLKWPIVVNISNTTQLKWDIIEAINNTVQLKWAIVTSSDEFIYTESSDPLQTELGSNLLIE